MYSLMVGDNGVGFPENIDFQDAGSLGLELVNTLTNQIGGTIRLNGIQGTEFTILFSGQGNSIELEA